MAHGSTVDTGAWSGRNGAEEVPLHKPLPSEQARCYRVTAAEGTLTRPLRRLRLWTTLFANHGEQQAHPSLLCSHQTWWWVRHCSMPKTIMSRWGWLTSLVSQGKFVAARRWQVVNLYKVSFTSSSNLAQETGGNKPDHLKDLYTRRAGGLSDGQHLQLLELLCEFQDIFSTGPQDLGRTG